MRRIIKAPSEPVEFSNWKNETHRPKFENIPTYVKKKLREALSREQKNVCCYCGINLEGINSHVEHVIPQATGTLRLNYGNVHLSCNGDNPQELRLGEGDGTYCGSAKGDSSIAVTPTQTNCESRFTYLMDGRVLPAQSNDLDAKSTIDTLKLNNQILIDMRQEVIGTWVMSILENDSDQVTKTKELNEVLLILDKEHNNGLTSYAFQVKQVIYDLI